MTPRKLFVTSSVALLVVLPACGPAGKSIQDTGSETLSELAQAWAEAYQKVKPDVSVQVSGGGSGGGIAALEAGNCDIANASREIEPAEVQTAKANTGKEVREYTVALDALAIYVPKDNPLDTISIEELAEMYGEGGKIDKWSGLGIKVPGCGSDEIQRFSRQSSSGTWKYFREAILGKGREYKPGGVEASGAKDIVTRIANTPCAIGYSGMGFHSEAGVKWLKVSRKKGEPSIEPSVKAVLDHSYPIARKLYMYTLGEPTGEVKAYLDWILSPAGQKIVEEVGFVPVPAGTPQGVAPFGVSGAKAESKSEPKAGAK